MKSCRIFSAGDYNPAVKKYISADLTIAVDAGYNFTCDAGIEPDIVLGDFDSLGFVPKAKEIIRHPVMKDDTDTLLAVRTGLRRGCDVFYIYGGLGGRLDHTLANIQTLKFISDHGAKGFLIGVSENVTVLKNETAFFYPCTDGLISVFAFDGDAFGVTLDGLLYPLTNAHLTEGLPIGVSNEFTGVSATVSVTNGSLAVIWSADFELLDRSNL